jgi:iron complex outermembrane receptor protein
VVYLFRCVASGTYATIAFAIEAGGFCGGDIPKARGNYQMRKTPIAAAISIALANGSLVLSSPVLAQDVDDADTQSSEVIDEVITTGSRIRKDAFTSSSPMDVIDVDQASLQGIANVGELLRRNSAAAGSPQVTAATSGEFVQNGGVGANTVSLRGLGANRTLVLINGRRPGPAGTRGGVSSFDINILPLSTIERVEILKDGASSIYGSDAVAGVINIITRKDDGGMIDGFISQPSDDGGEESRLSATWGKNFDGGSFRISADYNKQEELARGDRDYFECGNQFIFDQGTGERADVIDPRSGKKRCQDLTWGHIWIYDFGAENIPSGPTRPADLAQYDYDGDLDQYIPGFGAVGGPGDLAAPPGWFPVGYDRNSLGVTNSDHPFQDESSLVPENENFTLYVEGEIELNSGVELYGEVLLNRRKTYFNDYRQYWSFAVYSGNFDFYDYYAGGNESAADAGWFGAQFHSPTAITDHSDTEVEVNYQRAVAGLRGEFGDTSWDWDASLSWSRSDGDYTDEQIYGDSIYDSEWRVGPGPRNPGFDQDALLLGSGTCVGTFSSVRGAPCVDIPWFSPDLMNGDLTPELRDFMYGIESGKTEYTQWSIDGSATGDLFELPAGTLAVAVGFHYREDELDDLPGEITRAGNTWGASAAGNTVGDDTTQAVFIELDAPLLTDIPGIQNLTLNASARYTDVDSYGSDTTWKVGVNWQIIDSLRLRANQGTSFRTPALFELFLADQTSFPSRVDPCNEWGQALVDGEISQNVADNCAADQSSIGGPAAGLPDDYQQGSISPTAFTGGGFGILEAETSKSQTIGFIWQPAFADISASIDYFDITVRNEVDQLTARTIVNECYASEFGFAFGNSEPLCDLFDRTNAGFGIDNIRDSFLNIAEQTNRGMDYAVRYNTELGSLGSLGVELQATRQLEDTRAIFSETKEELNGLIGDPKWAGEFNVSFYRGPLAVNYSGHYVGTSDSRSLIRDDETILLFDTRYDAVMHTDSVVYHNLSVSYDFEDEGLRVLLGVANLTAEDPPQISNVTAVTDEVDVVGNSVFYSQYDWFGRRVFANLTWTFD